MRNGKESRIANEIRHRRPVVDIDMCIVDRELTDLKLMVYENRVIQKILTKEKLLLGYTLRSTLYSWEITKNIITKTD